MFGPSFSIVYQFKKDVFNFVIYEVSLNKMAAMNSEKLILHSVTEPLQLYYSQESRDWYF